MQKSLQQEPQSLDQPSQKTTENLDLFNDKTGTDLSLYQREQRKNPSLAPLQDGLSTDLYGPEFLTMSSTTGKMVTPKTRLSQETDKEPSDIMEEQRVTKPDRSKERELRRKAKEEQRRQRKKELQQKRR